MINLPSITNSSSVFKVLVPALAFTALVLAALPQLAGAVGPQGSLDMRMAFGKAGKVLNKQGVRVGVTGKKTSRKGSGVNLRVKLPVREVSIDGRSTVSLGGTLVFERKVKGKVRKVKLNSPTFRGSEASRVVRARHSGKEVAIFSTSGPYEVDRSVGTVVLPRQDLRFTSNGAKLIRKGLRLKKLPASKVGTLALDSQAAFEDPFATECELPATSKTRGSLPVVGPLPTFEPSTPLTGDNLTWGFKASFRGYISNSGLFRGEGGATVNAGFPGAPPTGFTFPFQSGDLAGDSTRTVESASGSITACHKGQFRLTMSEPAVVIDGAESRIVMTIDTNISGDWVVGQRVDFATLNPTGISPVDEDGVLTWTAVPAVLTQNGAAALRLRMPGGSGDLYPAGTELDPITVKVRTGGA